MRFAAIAFVLCVMASPSFAQYMYLDADGDGVHGPNDRLNANGVPTIAELYLVTNRNRDGLPAICKTADGDLTINTYAFNLRAVNGTVVYSNFVNLMTGFIFSFGEVNPGDGISYKNGYGQMAGLAPGIYRLARLTVTGQTGSPRINIVDRAEGSADFTSFGTQCSGNDFDNTYKLTGVNGGSDWVDTDGLGPVTGGAGTPILDVMSHMQGAEGMPVTIVATGTDPDDGTLLTFSQAGAPPFLSFTHVPAASPATATLSGVPQFSDAGTYVIDWTLTNGVDMPVTSRTTLVIDNTDRASSLSPVGDISMLEGATQEFEVSASDPDGQSPSLRVGLPEFGTMGLPTATPGASTALVTLSPGFQAAGSYTVHAIATSGCTSDVRTFQITVLDVDRPPTLLPIPNQDIRTDTTAIVTIEAMDPDGQTVTLSGAIPPFASFEGPTSGPGHVACILRVAPSEGDVGTHTASVQVDAGGVIVEQVFTIQVISSNLPPTLSVPAEVGASEGEHLNIEIRSVDPEGEVPSLFGDHLPAGCTVQDQGGGVASLIWQPGFDQAGSYELTLVAEDQRGRRGSATCRIDVVNVNRSPTVLTGGPYQGTEGVPVAFSGAGSGDPDGDPVVFLWGFGDGSTATGMDPSHVFIATGSYTVTLSVQDWASVSSEATEVTIHPQVAARAFVSGASPILLGSAEPTNCIQLEVDGFQAGDINISSLRMRREIGGPELEIAPVLDKRSVGRDTDHNGFVEVDACFSKQSIRELFESLLQESTVPMVITGSTVDGHHFRADFQLSVDPGIGVELARVTPNPMNPSGTLGFRTQAFGSVSITILDASGRRVRRLLDHASMSAGNHYVSLDGLGRDGRPLPSGVYYYKIDSPEGLTSGKFTILR